MTESANYFPIADAVAAIAKIGLVSQAEAGAALAPTSAFPSAPTLCSVHSFTGAWTRFLRSIPAAGARLQAQPVRPMASACRVWAESPRCSVVWRVGSNVLNNRKGRPRLSSVTLPPPFQLAETALPVFDFYKVCHVKSGAKPSPPKAKQSSCCSEGFGEIGGAARPLVIKRTAPPAGSRRTRSLHGPRRRVGT
jgi:hypothetical protein